MQLNRPITMCIAQFNLYLVVLVVAILPITRPAIASHNLARFNSGINPGIKQTQSRNPGIGKTVRDCIPYMYLYGPDCPDIKDLTISHEGVEERLSNLNITKASGPDSIPCRFFK